MEGKLMLKKKQQLLLWICDMQKDEIALETLVKEENAEAVLLLFMVKKLFIAPFESKLIAQANQDVRNGNIPDPFVYPKNINMRAFRATFIFTKFYAIFQSCLAFAGMKDLQTELLFDGAHFQNVYQASKI